jgi:hypothetical protein
MSKITGISLVFILLLSEPGWLFGQMSTPDRFLPIASPIPVSEKNITRQGNIKINPATFLFNEISVSYEHFKKISGIRPSAPDLTGIDSIIYKRKAEQTSSVNYIFGFIFPSDINNMVQYKKDIHNACIRRFEDAGMSPFINWGLSFKLEFRRYWNTFYYGPQFMGKFIFYPEKYIDNKSGTEMEGVVRLQSGHANILGFGYFVGLQTENKGFVTDLFLGAGCRLRLAVRKIYEEQNYLGPNVIFPEPKTENLNRIYPALNFGIRLGFNI